MKTNKKILLLSLVLCSIIFLSQVTNADGADILIEDDTLCNSSSPTPEIIVFEMATKEEKITPIPNPNPTPTPISKEDFALSYKEEVINSSKNWKMGEDERCLSRGIRSICPKRLNWIGQMAFTQMVINMVEDDSGAYKDTVRYTLLMKSEFAGYDPTFSRTEESDEVARAVGWIWNSDDKDKYWLIPKDGVHCAFSSNKKYITIMDKDYNVVFDSSEYPY